MSAVSISRDETLELRLKALRLPSFLEQYIELAERAAAEGWSHVRYLAELVTQEASDRADRRTTRLLLDAKLPKDKSVATLDLNRYAAPLRGQIRELLRLEVLVLATNVCAIGCPPRPEPLRSAAARSDPRAPAWRVPRRRNQCLSDRPPRNGQIACDGGPGPCTGRSGTPGSVHPRGETGRTVARCKEEPAACPRVEAAR